MRLRWKVTLATLAFAILGFLLDPNAPVGGALWPEPPAGPAPTSAQVGLLMGISAIQAIGFGLGFAFLLFARPLMARIGSASTGLTTAAYFAIAWSLVSWVPHGAMHQTNAAADFTRLVFIEYAFHGTLVVAACVVAAWFAQATGTWRRTRV